MVYFNQDALTFLKELQSNNNRDWFNANKKRYEENLKAPFLIFVGDLIEALRPHYDSLAITPKDAIFRIYRDVRFSKDKSPYKTKISAIITSGGRKDMTSPGVYIEFSADDARVYSGLYRLDAKQLKNVRTHISYNLEKFADMISAKGFVNTFGEVRGEKNKRLSKEFLEDAESQPLLFNKSFYYFTSFKPEIILTKNLVEKVVSTFLIAKPVSEFLNEGLEG